MRLTINVILAAAILAAAPVEAVAQPVAVGDAVEVYHRVLQISGDASLSSLSLRPESPLSFDGQHPWSGAISNVGRMPIVGGIAVHDLLLRTTWNTSRPYGRNDGAIWRGRGMSGVLTTGFTARLGLLSASLRPELMYIQNSDFDLSPAGTPAGYSEFAYPTSGRSYHADIPQRFGEDAYLGLAWGQSYARVDYRGLAAGVSTQNMWWGPSLRNAIVLSNHGPGIPRAYVATGKPIDVWIGKLEAQWFWGSLQESRYFDDIDENDRRYLSGIGIVYEPKWVSGLFLGTTRTVLQSWPDNWRVSDLLSVTRLGRADSARHAYDETASVFARFVFPQSGLEVYGEWARGEPVTGFVDLLREPGHGVGYTIGAQKAFSLSKMRRLRAFAEITRLDAGRTSFVRGVRSVTFFYADDVITQGYTHRGQVLGAGIGPGGLSQTFGLDYFERWGSVGLLLERVVYDNDALYSTVVHRFRHMVGIDVGLHGRIFYEGFEIAGGVTYDRILNEYYQMGDDVTNFHLELSLRRMLGGVR